MPTPAWYPPSGPAPPASYETPYYDTAPTQYSLEPVSYIGSSTSFDSHSQYHTPQSYAASSYYPPRGDSNSNNNSSNTSPPHAHSGHGVSSPGHRTAPPLRHNNSTPYNWYEGPPVHPDSSYNAPVPSSHSWYSPATTTTTTTTSRERADRHSDLRGSSSFPPSSGWYPPNSYREENEPARSPSPPPPHSRYPKQPRISYASPGRGNARLRPSEDEYGNNSNNTYKASAQSYPPSDWPQPPPPATPTLAAPSGSSSFPLIRRNTSSMSETSNRPYEGREGPPVLEQEQQQQHSRHSTSSQEHHHHHRYDHHFRHRNHNNHDDDEETHRTTNNSHANNNSNSNASQNSKKKEGDPLSLLAKVSSAQQENDAIDEHHQGHPSNEMLSPARPSQHQPPDTAPVTSPLQRRPRVSPIISPRSSSRQQHHPADQEPTTTATAYRANPPKPITPTGHHSLPPYDGPMEQSYSNRQPSSSRAPHGPPSFPYYAPPSSHSHQQYSAQKLPSVPPSSKYHRGGGDWDHFSSASPALVEHSSFDSGDSFMSATTILTSGGGPGYGEGRHPRRAPYNYYPPSQSQPGPPVYQPHYSQPPNSHPYYHQSGPAPTPHTPPHSSYYNGGGPTSDVVGSEYSSHWRQMPPSPHDYPRPPRWEYPPGPPHHSYSPPRHHGTPYPTSSQSSGRYSADFSAAGPPPTLPPLPDSQQQGMMPPATRKYAPYTYVQQPRLESKTVLKKKFSWKNYPELERFLIANRDDYLRHSSKNYTLEQKTYNNWLTDRLLQVAEKNHYIFDPEDFNFVAIRDRIRCYYKSYVQTARKRGLPLPKSPGGSSVNNDDTNTVSNEGESAGMQNDEEMKSKTSDTTVADEVNEISMEDDNCNEGEDKQKGAGCNTNVVETNIEEETDTIVQINQDMASAAE